MNPEESERQLAWVWCSKAKPGLRIRLHSKVRALIHDALSLFHSWPVLAASPPRRPSVGGAGPVDDPRIAATGCCPSAGERAAVGRDRRQRL